MGRADHQHELGRRVAGQRGSVGVRRPPRVPSQRSLSSRPPSSGRYGVTANAICAECAHAHDRGRSFADDMQAPVSMAMPLTRLRPRTSSPLVVWLGSPESKRGDRPHLRGEGRDHRDFDRLSRRCRWSTRARAGSPTSRSRGARHLLEVARRPRRSSGPEGGAIPGFGARGAHRRATANESNQKRRVDDAMDFASTRSRKSCATWRSVSRGDARARSRSARRWRASAAGTTELWQPARGGARLDRRTHSRGVRRTPGSAYVEFVALLEVMGVAPGVLAVPLATSGTGCERASLTAGIRGAEAGLSTCRRIAEGTSGLRRVAFTEAERAAGTPARIEATWERK